MRPDRARWASARAAGLVTTLIFTAATVPLYADPAEEPSRRAPERRPCCQPAVGSWQDFVQLEVQEKELTLTNVSDRVIVAWTVRQVTRITEGNEGYGSITMDAADYPLFPDGYERLLHPGESLTLERPADPWIRPDLKGPEYLVYYDVGALVFDDAEWVGDPKFVHRIFEGRLAAARRAMSALDVIASGNEDLDGLPERYQGRLEEFPNRADALRAIHRDATEFLGLAESILRPEDLAKLPRLEERLP